MERTFLPLKFCREPRVQTSSDLALSRYLRQNPLAFLLVSKFRSNLKTKQPSTVLAMHLRVSLILAVVALEFSLSRADFGDYADDSFECPARTTCAKICVAEQDICPTKCADGLELCPDGTCEANCPAGLESPCEFKCASVACAKVIDSYDQCQTSYGEFYEAEAACGEIETAEETVLFQYNEAGFLVGYAWIVMVSVMIVVWCFFK
jgi:hypothetical protein